MSTSDAAGSSSSGSADSSAPVPAGQTDEPFAAEIRGLPFSADSERLQARDRLEVAISRFADQVRQGDAPSIDEFTAGAPEVAGELRELLPFVALLERWKADRELDCLRRNLPREFPIRRLGNYQIVRELGRGGMGIVFEAVKSGSERRVAIKLLPFPTAAAQPHWAARFRSEAQTIAALRHPNIVPVYSFGQSGGYCYYVMEFVEGISLDRVIHNFREMRSPGGEIVPVAEQAVPTGGAFAADDWSAIAGIGLQAALALDYAHHRGVLHNDIKPANLLRDKSGRVIVTDFAIGRGANPEAGDATSQSPPGTLRYAAPERLLGQSDARSDIYSLGLTLYELLAHRPAFDARDSRELAELILHADVCPPRRVRRQIPKPLEAVVLQAIARDPARRYASAAALAADLRRFVQGERIHARPVSVLARFIWWARG